ncbi:MAG: transcription antitermination factor NusB [Rickettsiales bacterium]
MSEVRKSGHNQSLQKKRAARMAAVQCIYEKLAVSSDISPEVQIAELKKHVANNKDEQKLRFGVKLEPNYSLLKDILEGVVKWSGDIEKRIGMVISEKWGAERTSPILVSILRCAIFEMFFYKDTARKIIIDEYSGITGHFFARSEVNFINGALKELDKNFSAIV